MNKRKRSFAPRTEYASLPEHVAGMDGWRSLAQRTGLPVERVADLGLRGELAVLFGHNGLRPHEELRSLDAAGQLGPPVEMPEIETRMVDTFGVGVNAASAATPDSQDNSEQQGFTSERSSSMHADKFAELEFLRVQGDLDSALIQESDRRRERELRDELELQRLRIGHTNKKIADMERQRERETLIDLQHQMGQFTSASVLEHERVTSHQARVDALDRHRQRSQQLAAEVAVAQRDGDRRAQLALQKRLHAYNEDAIAAVD